MGLHNERATGKCNYLSLFFFITVMKSVYLFILIGVYSLIQSTDCLAQVNKKLDKVKQFIPPAYEILDALSGDMNADGFTDYIMVLRNENEDINGDELRPLLIIAGNRNGQLSLLERNDSVVLCKNCGGVFGDPFERLTFKDGLLRVEHNVGNNWRWSRDISFKYDDRLHEFVLNNDAFSSYDKSNSNKQTAVLTPQAEDNKSLFKNFSFRKTR